MATIHEVISSLLPTAAAAAAAAAAAPNGSFGRLMEFLFEHVSQLIERDGQPQRHPPVDMQRLQDDIDVRPTARHCVIIEILQLQSQLQLHAHSDALAGVVFARS